MQEINKIVRDAEKLALEGKIEQALAIFLDAIDKYKPADTELADEAAFQMGYFLFEQHFYVESIETWKKLQEKGSHKEEISEIIEEAFIVPNKKEFQSIYEKNLREYKKQIHAEKICGYEELPVYFIPAEIGVYYLYGKNEKQIGEKVAVSAIEYSDDEIFSGENAFDTVVFWKNWKYTEPMKMKQRNHKQMVCFLSDTSVPFSYLQLPEFEELFQKEWHIFDELGGMKAFFHEHKELSLPRIFKGIQEEAELFQRWMESEHEFRCSKEGRENRNILLTIGIPSYNRGHRALQNVRNLQRLFYDSEIEFLICDNCSQLNIEGYQEIEKLAEEDCRITYYRFPDKPGDNPSPAETVKRAAGKFCCLLSDEDLVYLENVWKYLYLIQKYESTVSFINAAGRGYYHDNVNKKYEKGESAFQRVFWGLNYMSGLMFKTEIYHKLKLYNLYHWQTEGGQGNFFKRGYAHNVAAMRCALETDIYTSGELMFQEGKEDEFSASYREVKSKEVLEFATVDNRLKQLRGVVDLLNEWKDMLSPSIIKCCYRSAVAKVFMLIDLIRRQGRVIECSFKEAHDHILRAGIDEVKQLDIDLEDSEYADMVIEFSYWYIEYTKACTEK